MNRSRAEFFVFAVVTLAFCPGCDSDLPRISWEGDNVRFGTDRAEPPCGDTLEHLDEMVGILMRRLKIESLPDKKVTFYWVDEDTVMDHCDTRAACSKSSVVISSDPIHQHELVHAVTSAFGRKHRLLGEGLAVAFGGSSFVLSECPCNATADRVEAQMVPNLAREDIDYRSAGRFVRYLVETYGLDSLEGLIGLTDSGSGLQAFDVACREVFEMPVEDLLRNFAGAMKDRCVCYDPPPLCFGFVEPEESWPVVLEAEIGCEQADTTGPFIGLGTQGYAADSTYLASSYEVGTAAGGLYDITVEAEQGISGMLLVGSCGFDPKCPTEPTKILPLGGGDEAGAIAGEPTTILALGPSRIDIHVSGLLADRGLVRITIDEHPLPPN